MNDEVKDKPAPGDHNSEIIIYQTVDGIITIDVRLEDETVWLTQEHMAELFGKNKKTISEHIRNIFSEGELDESVVIRKFRTTTRHGAMADKTQSRDVQFYNLDVIISVGYRVKSQQGTRFRIWATQRLIQHEESLKELELDIKQIAPPQDKRSG